MKPVCYLDLDDTLICWNWAERKCWAAPGAREFLRFLMEHFEVRWLTLWSPDGHMDEEKLGWLEGLFRIPREELRPLHNPRPFSATESEYRKHEGIDFEEVRAGRPFVWIEDKLLDHDRAALQAEGLEESYLHCNVTEAPESLGTVHRLLCERFALLLPG